MSRQLVNLEAPRIDADTALEIMVHHLEMAAMYYEAIDSDKGAALAEVTRILNRDGGDHPRISGALAWLREMDRRDDEIIAHYGRDA